MKELTITSALTCALVLCTAVQAQEEMYPNEVDSWKHRN